MVAKQKMVAFFNDEDAGPCLSLKDDVVYHLVQFCSSQKPPFQSSLLKKLFNAIVLTF